MNQFKKHSAVKWPVMQLAKILSFAFLQSLQWSLLLQAVVLTASSVVGPQDQDQTHSTVSRVPFNKDKPHSLVLLQLLFRHGDRSPIYLFPEWDSHQSAWPQGPGQLTKLGMKQAYSYGGKLRQRYANFFSNLTEYNHFQVEVQSTDYDRTLMTVQCLLVGLFPANITHWPPTLSEWQPIPVHTQPVASDQLFAHASCPLLQRLSTQNENSFPAEQLRSKFAPLFKQLSKHTGIEVNQSTATHISDTMFCEAQHNLSRPDWMTDKIFAQLMMLRNESCTIIFKAPGAARLTGGPVLAEMVKNMEQRADDFSWQKKLFLFSAHDSNIANLGRALDIFNNLQPPYLTSIVLELHEQDGNFFVKTLFDNHTSDSPYQQTISGCEAMCPLTQFHSLLKNNMLTAADREKACVDGNSSEFFKQNGSAILAGALIVLAVAVMVLAYKLKRARSRHKASAHYRQLLQNGDEDDEEDENDDL